MMKMSKQEGNTIKRVTWRKRGENTGKKQEFKKTHQWRKPYDVEEKEEETQGRKVNRWGKDKNREETVKT